MKISPTFVFFGSGVAGAGSSTASDVEEEEEDDNEPLFEVISAIRSGFEN